MTRLPELVRDGEGNEDDERVAGEDQQQAGGLPEELGHGQTRQSQELLGR